MKNRMYTIKDRLGVFKYPFAHHNDDCAIRDFVTLCRDNSKQTIISQYPEDFTLYYIGDFDDESAEINVMDPIVLLAKGDSIAKEVKDVQE